MGLLPEEMAPVLAKGKGWITNIQDFSLHDGPGIRVLVFLRGCPLNCSWCQNPESYYLLPQVEFHKALCLGCWRCIEVCPAPGAIIRDEDQRIDRTKCTKCMVCVEECPGKALKKVGEQVLVGELVQKIVQYKPFFDHSDRGGITLSGGEPTFQPEFTLGVLKLCRESGIHTVMETCGYVNYGTLKKIMQYVDLLIYDIKHMNETKHISGTGRSNRLILRNLRRLCKEHNGAEIIVHIPLICGFNDDEENIDETAKFVKSLKKIGHIDLLPFNELASEKYRAMGLNWKYCGVKRQSPEYLTRLQEIIRSRGIEVTIGGLW
jgi:pyruvate formate lyase activating enzyme